jgi:hypothetical protein
MPPKRYFWHQGYSHDLDQSFPESRIDLSKWNSRKKLALSGAEKRAKAAGERAGRRKRIRRR